jgi:hypothetical protein
MTSGDNNSKCKLEKEAESSTVRKRLRPPDNDASTDDSSDSSEKEIEEEVSSEEMSMNQFDTSEEKSQAKHARGIVFGDNGDTTSLSSEPCTPESC